MWDSCARWSDVQSVRASTLQASTSAATLSHTSVADLTCERSCETDHLHAESRQGQGAPATGWRRWRGADNSVDGGQFGTGKSGANSPGGPADHWAERDYSGAGPAELARDDREPERLAHQHCRLRLFAAAAKFAGNHERVVELLGRPDRLQGSTVLAARHQYWHGTRIPRNARRCTGVERFSAGSVICDGDFAKPATIACARKCAGFAVLAA